MNHSGRPPRKLSLTTPRQVALSALSGAVFAGLILAAFDLFATFPPVVPWSVPAVLLVMAVGAWIYARGMPDRLENHTLSGLEAVRALIVAKSMVMTGAVLAGGHAVYVGRFVGTLMAEQPAARALHGAGTIIASLLLALAGWTLEKACIISVDDDSDEGGMPAGDPA
ncbi:DUF3180 domain-containing protein [Tessaracoccus antarcticus]|uniref:DUF3180 domain-containing protein n=1 Tax=Tessaracoccus antarcticus TaxID=2479848 RepID=UPI001313DAD0|nr:DUF3180 domain-containing protein [Tessaracoccus antarcticus]